MSTTCIDDQLATARATLTERIIESKDAHSKVNGVRADLALLRRSRDARPSEIDVMEARLGATQVRTKAADEAVANQRALVESLESRQLYERKQQLISGYHKLAPSIIDLENKLAEIAHDADSLLYASGESAPISDLLDVADADEAAWRYQLLQAALRLWQYINRPKG